MVDKIRRLGRLYALYARIDFLWLTYDLKNFIICTVSELVCNISSLMGIFLLSARFGGIGGLSTEEVLFMLGFYTFSTGVLFMMLGGSNVTEISRRVGRGQVDHMLIQPVPLPFQLLAEGFIPASGNSGAILGLILVIYATNRVGITVTPVWIGQFSLLLLARIGVEVGVSYLLGAAAFYKPVACEEISSIGIDAFRLLGRYPLSGLPTWLIEVLITVLPVGLMGWFPAMVLLDKVESSLGTLLPVVVAGAFLALATHFFRKGLKYYAKTGSNRYRDMGFRN